MNARLHALLAGLLILVAPALARACPMCFNGTGQNQSAFVYGSLLLMFVPTITIGLLVYWAWRRACAHDAELNSPRPPRPSEAVLPEPVVEAPALRAVGRG